MEKKVPSTIFSDLIHVIHFKQKTTSLPWEWTHLLNIGSNKYFHNRCYIYQKSDENYYLLPKQQCQGKPILWCSSAPLGNHKSYQNLQYYQWEYPTEIKQQKLRICTPESCTKTSDPKNRVLLRIVDNKTYIFPAAVKEYKSSTCKFYKYQKDHQHSILILSR